MTSAIKEKSSSTPSEQRFDSVSSPEQLFPTSGHNDWLSTDELAELTVPKIVDRLNALQNLMASKAVESEQMREAHPEVWSELRKTGMFYTLVPNEYGGLNGSMEDFADIILPIAEIDASLAWSAAFSVMHQWLVALFPKACRDEVWGKYPYITTAGSAFPPGKATKADGGYRISAHHKYCSGIMQSEAVHGFSVYKDEDGNDTIIMALIPIDQVKVLDTWRIDGMAGTGSHDVVYEDVFVPEHMAFPVAALKEGDPNGEHPTYRLPFSCMLSQVICLPMIGALKAEVQNFRKSLMAPGPDGTVPDNPVKRATLARAEIDAKTAELLVRDSIKHVYDAMSESGSTLSKPDRIRFRAQLSYAGNMSMKGLRTISDVSSTSHHFLHQPLQRMLRDVTVLSSHATLDIHSSLDEHARQLLDMPSEWWLA